MKKYAGRPTALILCQYVAFLFQQLLSMRQYGIVRHNETTDPMIIRYPRAADTRAPGSLRQYSIQRGNDYDSEIPSASD